MSDTCNAVVTMAVDTKKYGIRIHKALFRQLGEPRYIQLLVNPDDGVVAIQTVEKEMSGGQTHRIVEKRMHSETLMRSTAGLLYGSCGKWSRGSKTAAHTGSQAVSSHR